jgi:DNA-binding transcriptional LysR family regulator
VIEYRLATAEEFGTLLAPPGPGYAENAGMEIRELRAFVAVVEEGGMSAAARRLHMSQSALSQTIRSLERQLGTRLLERSHTGATATEVGGVLLREARALIDRHDRAVGLLARASGHDNAAAGLLRIGVPLEFPVDLLPAALTQLSVVHPDTRIDVRHSSSTVQTAALRSGDLDLALVRDRPPDQRFDAVLAVREPMGVVLATRRAEEIAEPHGVQLRDRLSLPQEPFIARIGKRPRPSLCAKRPHTVLRFRAPTSRSVS